MELWLQWTLCAAIGLWAVWFMLARLGLLPRQFQLAGGKPGSGKKQSGCGSGCAHCDVPKQQG